jgi:hypothetical protein
MKNAGESFNLDDNVEILKINSPTAKIKEPYRVVAKGKGKDAAENRKLFPAEIHRPSVPACGVESKRDFSLVWGLPTRSCGPKTDDRYR